MVSVVLLGTIMNDYMPKHERYDTSKEVQYHVKLDPGETTVTLLRQLQMDFDRFTKRPRTILRQHPKIMNNMITELA